MEQIGSMFSLHPFAITGTLFQESDNKITFNLPKCIRTPFNVGLSPGNVQATIPFKGFEENGNSPFTVVVTSGTELSLLGNSLDAGAGARVLSEYAMLDAGAGARTLSEYTMYDRGLI